MRNNVPTAFGNAIRKVKARAKVLNEHPKFDPVTLSSAPVAFAQFTQYPQNAYYVYQYGMASGSNTIYLGSVSLDASTQPVNRGFSATGFTFPTSEVPLSENHRAVAACDGAFFAVLNGKIYRSDFNKGYIWTLIADLTDPVTLLQPQISFVAISPTLLVAAASYSSTSVSDNCKLAVIENGVVDIWKGFLPKSTTRPHLAAVQMDDGTVYIYVDDWSGKKPVYIRRFAKGIWSATREILPMDALDEESSFTVGYATRLSNGRVFLTGLLQRQYGPAYAIYMLGPDKFTFGRDLILYGRATEPLQIVESETEIWGVGVSKAYHSTGKNGIFGDTIPTNEVDMLGFNADFTLNGADRLQFEVPTHCLVDLPNDLVPGARIDLEASVNDQAYTVGQFGIDRIRTQQGEEGDSYMVDCSSRAIKKLMDWESDTYFDYMGQGEVHGDPGDLTKLVRFSGSKYDTTGGGLALQSLNDDGMLYTTPPASHGGFIRCKFTNIQATNTWIGVGLNYSEETLAETAARMGKKIEEVKAADRARRGLFAIYIPDPYGGAQTKIWLADYNTARIGNMEDPTVSQPWRIIATAINVARPSTGGTAVLAMQYQDGYARVYYGSMDTPDLQLVISCEAILDWELVPAEHENFGRGLIYLRNNTGCHLAYPVMSDSDVIPLYSTYDKYHNFGVPLEDRVDKFPASNGTVQIDSEKILYTGIAGWAADNGSDKRTNDLQWIPGKVIAKAGDGFATPSGTDTNFAQTRGSGSPHVHGNNYLLQNFTVPDGTILTAVRVWLKKVNYPEDGVTLTIRQGNVGSSANAVALLQSDRVRAYGSSMGANQISSDGSWITFYLDRDVTVSNVAGDQYWIEIRRNKNANHPSSASYFQYKKMADSTYTGGGCYVFCEEDDQAVGQSGDMAFIVYARVDSPNKEYMFPVLTAGATGLPASDPGTYWAGCALTITNGGGKNNCYRIVRSFRLSDSQNNLYVFCLDRDPGRIFDSGTKARAVPALYGLKRAQSSTLAAAHGDKSFVHLPTSAFAKASYFEYFSAEEDLTLAEVAESIARKAGVVETDLCNRHSGTVTGGGAHEYISAQSKNLVVALTIPALGTTSDYVAITFEDANQREVMAAQLTISNINNTLFGTITFSEMDWYWNGTYWMEYVNNALSLPFDEAAKGDFRLSLYDGHFSMWCGGRLLGAVCMGALLKDWSRFYVAVPYNSPAVKVMVPQAGTRVDNFVMDMGKTGSQLLQTLVGEKRIFYRDDGQGRLKIYTERSTCPTVYTRSAGCTKELTDIGLATRVLLEGGEVVEVSDTGNLRKYGNFFKSVNINEINNLDDAHYFAGVILEDMALNRERVEITGAVDLVVEPSDIVTVTMKGNTNRQVVVDTVSHTMHIDETDAVYDMRLSGRFAAPAN